MTDHGSWITGGGDRQRRWIYEQLSLISHLGKRKAGEDANQTGRELTELFKQNHCPGITRLDIITTGE